MRPGDMPLAAFDLETTGVDPTECRIVTASIVLIDGADTTVREWLLDPEVDIPEQAAKVHGITTEHAREHGTDYAAGLVEIRAAVEQLWADGRLLVVMNAPYDLTILDRADGAEPVVAGPTFDPLVVDKHLDKYRSGSRNLTALAATYGVKQDDAHQSTGDCLAAARVAYKMLRHARMRPVDDVATLMQLQASWRAEQADSLRAYWQGKGDERWREVNGDWPVQLRADRTGDAWERPFDGAGE